MKALILLFIFTCMSTFVFSKEHTKDDNKRYSSIVEIPKDKYYTTDFMPSDYRISYGSWKAVNTAGGFDGRGFNLDFDHLILKENGIFAITLKDSLIAYGKMVLEKQGELLNCKFIFDKKAVLELANDYEKYFQFSHIDTLLLIAPCCDRYSIKLARER